MRSLISLTSLLIFSLFFIVPASASNIEPAAEQLQIFLQPLGEFPYDDLITIAAGLEESLHTKVTILPQVALPPSALNSRGRYRAADLLDYLADRCPRGSKIIGVTTEDISIKKGTRNDWGVFGLGDLKGPAAIVSSHRIKSHAAQRGLHLTAIAIHEMGHMLGLRHCENRQCLMAEGDDLSKTAQFCANCAKTIAPYLK